METPSIKVFVPPFDGGDESTAESKNLSILCQIPGVFRWNSWRQNWTRRDAVHANAFCGPRSRKRMREDAHRALARGEIEPLVDILRAKTAFASSARAVPVTRTFF